MGLVWSGGRAGFCMGTSDSKQIRPPKPLPAAWSNNQIQPLAQTALLHDTTEVPPGLPVQVQLISLPQRAGHSELCGRREIWKPTTTTDRVRRWRRQWCVQGLWVTAPRKRAAHVPRWLLVLGALCLYL